MSDKLDTEIDIVGFDMGKSNTGWNYSVFHTESKLFIVQAVGTITALKYATRAINRDKVALFGKSVITLDILETSIIEVLDKFRPMYISTESEWAGEMITAFVSLTLCNYLLSRIARDYNQGIYKIAPPEAKAFCTGNRRADKELIRKSLLENKKIIFDDSIDIGSMSEHEFDSISVSYTFCNKTLPTLKNNM